MGQGKAFSKEVTGDMEVDTSSVQPKIGSNNETNDNIRKKQRFAPMALDNRVFCLNLRAVLHCRVCRGSKKMH